MCMKVGKHGPALVYNIMWAIIAGLMMGPFMIPWFLGGGIIAELSMCGKDAYHDIKRVSISWVITALVRAAHGMSEIWFSKTHFLPPASASSRFRFRPSITPIRSTSFWVLLSPLSWPSLAAWLVTNWLWSTLERVVRLNKLWAWNLIFEPNCLS